MRCDAAVTDAVAGHRVRLDGVLVVARRRLPAAPGRRDVGLAEARWRGAVVRLHGRQPAQPGRARRAAGAAACAVSARPAAAAPRDAGAAAGACRHPRAPGAVHAVQRAALLRTHVLAWIDKPRTGAGQSRITTSLHWPMHHEDRDRCPKPTASSLPCCAASRKASASRSPRVACRWRRSSRCAAQRKSARPGAAKRRLLDRLAAVTPTGRAAGPATSSTTDADARRPRHQRAAPTPKAPGTGRAASRPRR